MGLVICRCFWTAIDSQISQTTITNKSQLPFNEFHILAGRPPLRFTCIAIVRQSVSQANIHIFPFIVHLPWLIIAVCIQSTNQNIPHGSASPQGITRRHAGTKCRLIKILLLIYESECVQTCPHPKLTPSSIMDALSCAVPRRFLTFWIITLLWNRHDAQLRAETWPSAAVSGVRGRGSGKIWCGCGNSTQTEGAADLITAESSWQCCHPEPLGFRWHLTFLSGFDWRSCYKARTSPSKRKKNRKSAARCRNHFTKLPVRL